MADKIFTPYQKGDVLSAARLNELQSIVQEHDHLFTPPADVPGAQIKYVRLTDWIGPTSNFDNQTGVLQLIDVDTNQFVDTDPEQSVDIVTDPTASRAYSKDSIIPCHAHPSGLYIPLSGHARVLFGKPGSDIAAISGVTPDNQTVTIWEFDSDVGDFVVTDPAVTFTGYSTLTSVVPADTLTAFLFDGKKNWFASGGGGSGPAQSRIHLSTLTSDLLYTDATAAVASPPTDPVDNPLALAGLSGDYAVWVEDFIDGEFSSNYLLNVQHHACP
jgi:hypothetical protein